MNRTKSALKTVISEPGWDFLRLTYRRLRHAGTARFCPVCRSHVRRFQPYGKVRREEARCPVCNCMERHRQIYLFWQQHTNLFDRQPKKMLHVAPETPLSRVVLRHPQIDYLTADMYDPEVMVQMDITDIHYDEGTFDVILCSHVLEHVVEDRKAMREFHRVLKRGGWAILQVPMSSAPTFEDPSVTDLAERRRLFGQEDHVRQYGPDFKDRLQEAGFDVEVIDFSGRLGASAARRFGLTPGEDIYFCRKTAGAN